MYILQLQPQQWTSFLGTNELLMLQPFFLKEGFVEFAALVEDIVATDLFVAQATLCFLC